MFFKKMICKILRINLIKIFKKSLKFFFKKVLHILKNAVSLHR